MTFTEAQAELTELRGLAATDKSLATFKERVNRLYMAVCRKTLRKCNCKDVVDDALIEIYSKLKQLKNNDTMEILDTKARLVNGVVLKVDNNHYTNANLTDKVAREFLAEFPQRKDWFATLPAEEKDSEANTPKAEVGDKPSKVEVGVVIPKKKAAKKAKK